MRLEEVAAMMMATAVRRIRKEPRASGSVRLAGNEEATMDRGPWTMSWRFHASHQRLPLDYHFQLLPPSRVASRTVRVLSCLST